MMGLTTNGDIAGCIAVGGEGNRRAPAFMAIAAGNAGFDDGRFNHRYEWRLDPVGSCITALGGASA